MAARTRKPLPNLSIRTDDRGRAGPDDEDDIADSNKQTWGTTTVTDGTWMARRREAPRLDPLWSIVRLVGAVAVVVVGLSVAFVAQIVLDVRPGDVYGWFWTPVFLVPVAILAVLVLGPLVDRRRAAAVFSSLALAGGVLLSHTAWPTADKLRHVEENVGAPQGWIAVAHGSNAYCFLSCESVETYFVVRPAKGRRVAVRDMGRRLAAEGFTRSIERDDTQWRRGNIVVLIDTSAILPASTTRASTGARPDVPVGTTVRIEYTSAG